MNSSVVSGFSELGLHSPIATTGISHSFPTPNQYHLDPEANAPEVVPSSYPLRPRYPSRSYPEPAQPTPDFSMPQVVPFEQQRHGSLPEVLTKSKFDEGIEVVEQKSATKELREKRRARLNLIAGS